MKNYISYSECHALLFCRITTKPSDEIVDSTTEDGGNCCSRNIRLHGVTLEKPFVLQCHTGYADCKQSAQPV